MVHAAHYARTQGKPYFGICLGMQIAVIEYARSIDEAIRKILDNLK